MVVEYGMDSIHRIGPFNQAGPCTMFVCPPSTWSALRVITHARCLLSLSTTATTIVVLTNLTVVNLHYALAGFVHFWIGLNCWWHHIGDLAHPTHTARPINSVLIGQALAEDWNGQNWTGHRGRFRQGRGQGSSKAFLQTASTSLSIGTRTLVALGVGHANMAMSFPAEKHFPTAWSKRVPLLTPMDWWIWAIVSIICRIVHAINCFYSLADSTRVQVRLKIKDSFVVALSECLKCGDPLTHSSFTPPPPPSKWQ